MLQFLKSKFAQAHKSLNSITRPTSIRPTVYSKPFIIFCSSAALFAISSATHADAIETAGTTIQLVLPAVAILFTATHHDWKGLKQFGYATAGTLGTTYILKYSINETRPNGGSYSFPSGHTAISVDSSVFLWKRYGLKYGIPSMVAAAFVGYSRVEAKKHYWHDVIGAAAIATAWNLALVSKYMPEAEPIPHGVVLSKTFHFD